MDVDVEIDKNYPEGFKEWNEKFFELFLEGISAFPPELILGVMESVKILYLSRGVEIAQKNADTKSENEENIVGDDENDESDV